MIARSCVDVLAAGENMGVYVWDCDGVKRRTVPPKTVQSSALRFHRLDHILAQSSSMATIRTLPFRPRRSGAWLSLGCVTVVSCRLSILKECMITLHQYRMKRVS